MSLSDTINKANRWIVGNSQDGICGLGGIANPSLMPSCFNIIARECIGSTLPNRQKAWIQSHQDEETGLFIPGELRRRELSSHSATYLKMQATYFAIHALDALGGSPEYPITLVGKFTDVSYLEGWLNAGPWQNPWLHSNNIMFALCFLQLEGFERGDDAAMAAFDFILDYLDDRQDPATGLWQPDDGTDISNAVFAAYHFFPFYLWRGRRLAYIEQIIDSVLSIQRPDGLFVKNGGACEDLDAVHTLVMMSLLTDYRRSDVLRALDRCFWRLLQIQNDDGGFPNSVWKPNYISWKRRRLEKLGILKYLPAKYRDRGISKQPDWFYSGWKELGCGVGESDVWSAWFRPLSLRLISETIDDLPTFDAGRYRRLPGLGWHDPGKIESCRIESLHTNGRPHELRSEHLTSNQTQL